MVNTFLVSDDYSETAKILDYKRLGKQRVEAMQIINILENKRNKGWINHPATKMWKGYVNELKKYTNEMIKEWIRRGYKNTMELYDTELEETTKPWFVSCKILHYSHMASLMRKDRTYYKPFFYKKYPIEFEFFSYLWIGDLTSEDIQQIIEYNKKNYLPILRKYTDKIIISLNITL